MSQVLFAGLLVVAWAASLDLVAPLDTVDHWVGFALFAALGWKLIHDSVRLRSSPRSVSAATAGLILALTGLTFIDVLVPGAPLPRVIAPASILVAAILVIVASPLLARRASGPTLRRIAAARVTIASGLLLLGIALQVFIEHVP
jgi:putative Mn2+ efflux pump MntP